MTGRIAQKKADDCNSPWSWEFKVLDGKEDFAHSFLRFLKPLIFLIF